MRAWNQSEGAVNASLVDRRERERHLYLYGDVSLPGGVHLVEASAGGAALVGVAAAVAAYFALPRVSFSRRWLSLRPARS